MADLNGRNVVTPSSLRAALLPYQLKDARFEIEHRRLVQMLDAVGNFTVAGDLTVGDDLTVNGATFTLRFDASNHLVVTVASSGLTTFEATGSGASFQFNDIVGIVSTGTGQLFVGYDGSNFLSVDVSSAGLVTYNAGGASAKHLFADDVDVSSGKVYKVNNVQVVSAQGAAVANPTGGAVIDAEARTAIDAILARIEAHGLIAS